MTLDTFGPTLGTPLAEYDHDLQSWRTYGVISLWGLTECLQTLPKSGMTVNGVLYQQPEWVRPIDANELLSWPTPTAVNRPMEGNVRLYRAKVEAGEMTEAEAQAILGKSVWEAQGNIPAMWPTPTTQEVEHPNATWVKEGQKLRRIGKGIRGHSMGLADAVQTWPTPTVDDSKNVTRKSGTFQSLTRSVNSWPTPTASSWGSTGHRMMLDLLVESGEITQQDKQQMTSGNGGKLNPTWVEWLMGFPLGWTDLED
jgi:DNA (cytosine-5)-methyltransferase 1